MTLKRANPYVGPRSFETNETLYGRTRELRMLSAQLVSERVVLLHSPSGAGKTSLIQAGLVPLMKAEKFHILPVARVNLEPDAEVALTPGFNRYVYSVIASMEEELPPEQRCPLSMLAGITLDTYLAERSRPEDAPRSDLLLFDQFEEILTIAPTDREGKQVFFTQLGAALRNSTRWALFAMREDFLGAIAPYVRPLPNRFEVTFRLDLLGVDAALQAIQAPARDAGGDFADEAARKLVDDLRRVQVQLPDGSMEAVLGGYIEPVQLQVVCYRLWQSLGADETSVGLESLAAVGDVDQSLADYYALSVANSAAQTGISERALREWFETKLITKEGIRGQVLMGADFSDGLDNRVVRLLEDAHIIRGEKRAGATWFELSHDRLIQPVRNSNAQWFEQNLSLFQRQAKLWVQQNRSEGLLLRDKEYQQAEKETNALALTSDELSFLDACRKRHHQEQRDRKRNLFMTILAIGATIAMFVAGFFYLQAQSSASEAKSAAEQNAQLAQDNASVAATAQVAEQRAVDAQALTEKTLKETEVELRIARNQQLSAQAQILQNDKPQLAMLLALEAIKINQEAGEPLSDASYQALRDTLSHSYGIPLPGNTDTVLAMAFSSDGRWFVTGGEDQVVRVWDTRLPNFNQQPAFNLIGHNADVMLVALSDNNLLATGDSEGVIRVWDLSSDVPSVSPLVITAGQGELQTLAISFDGRWLAFSREDKVIYVRNLKSGNEEILELSTGTFALQKNGLAFSYDGKWLIAAAIQNLLAWDMAGSTPVPRNVTRPSPIVNAAGFPLQNKFSQITISPDGVWLVSGGYIWEMEKFPSDRPEIGPWGVYGLESLTSDIEIKYRLGWDCVLLNCGPDYFERTLASPAAWIPYFNSSTTLIGLSDIFNEFYVNGHNGRVSDMAFVHDSYWLFTLGSAEGDNTLRLWDVMSDDPFESSVAYYAGSENPIMVTDRNANWLAVTGNDNVVRILDTKTMNLTVDPINFYDSVSLVPSPDSNWLLSELGTIIDSGTFSERRKAFLYSISGNNSFLLPKSEFDVGVYKLFSKFSPGSSLLYLYESGSNKVIHNVSTGEPIRLFDQTSNWFFSPTDKWMVVGDAKSRTIINPSLFVLSLYDLYSRDSQDESVLAEPVLKEILLHRSDWYPDVRYGKHDQLYLYYTIDKTYPDQGILFDAQDNWLVISKGADTFFADLRATEKIASRNFVTKDFSSHAISADGTMLSVVELATGRAGLVNFDHIDFDAKNAQPVFFQDILQENEAPVFAAFSPDGRWMSISTCAYVEHDVPDGSVLRDQTVSICRQGEPASVFLWDISQQDPTDSMLQVSGIGSFKISFSANSRWLAAFESSGKTILFDLSQPKPISTELASSPAGMFSPDSRWLVTLNGYDEAIAQDLSDTEQIQIPLNSPGYQVISLKFSPDGNWLAGGTTDGKVFLWKMSTLGADTVPYILRGGTKAYEDLFFTNDGRWLFAGGPEANYVGWRMETQELINLACANVARNLTRAEWAQYGFTEDYRATCPQWPLEADPVSAP